MRPAEIKGQLVTLARDLGFEACCIAECRAPAHVAEFKEWLGEGSAGEMSWIERGAEKRANPELILPGAKSVIVLALNYWQGPVPVRQGRIARYAWGDDYHGLIEQKLEQLDFFLQRWGGRQKCYVDTGPVLERDFAAAAGIGWHGKSTMLINQELGTWFFLAEVLTTLSLPVDPPQVERCGTCVRCVAACPTGAIVSPHRLEARRCISYLTIEHKSSIPLELRPLIGDRIYGCDDCLEACPWNRFAQASRETAFTARPEVMEMKLRDFLALDDAGFRLLFRKSPIKRIKRRGFLRNVCVALGNVGKEDDLRALERAALDAEPLIAEHARWAIGQIEKRVKQAGSCTAGAGALGQH